MNSMFGKTFNKTSQNDYLKDIVPPLNFHKDELSMDIFVPSAQLRLCTSRNNPFVAGLIHAENTVTRLTSTSPFNTAA